MNRRGFFQTLLAVAAAIFLPKSKEATISVDPAVEGGDNSVTTWFTFGSDSNNEGCTVEFYTVDDGGTYHRLTEHQLRGYEHIFEEGDRYTNLFTKKTKIYDGKDWIPLIKENQNG